MSSFFDNLRTAANNNTQKDAQNVPKAPNFTYKNPATDNSIAFWRMFSDEGTMRHYDDLMGVLDKASEMKSKDEVRDYIGSLKNTITYKVNPGIQSWVNDFESLYYPSEKDKKYDMYYPIDVMMYQTTKALNAFINGYRSFDPTKKREIPSPSELLPKISSSYK